MKDNEKDQGKTIAFYGELIMNTLNGELICVVSQLDNLSKDEMVQLANALNTIRNFSDAIWRAKDW
jgi:hypothetical protein